jgi:hypothetical protein
MSKPIKELVEEAQAIGVNLHDYVAQEVFGAINMTTLHWAKQLTFGVLYGASPHVQKRAKEIEGMNEPYTGYADCPAVDIPPPLAEDRMHRVGVNLFEVAIFDDDGLVVTLPVHATSALDARCIAYIIDRGRKMQQWGDEQIEVALAHTKVVG